jgi:hypothetical protein
MFNIVMTGECDIWLEEDMPMMGLGLSSVVAGEKDEDREDMGGWSWKVMY